MTYRSIIAGVACLSLAVLPACTGHWATGSGEASASNRYRAGSVTESDLLIRLPEVLARRGFVVEEGMRYKGRYELTTQWKVREPFEDERERGVVDARTRIVVRAHRTATKYTLHLRIENMVRGTDEDWYYAPATDAFDEYAGGLAREIRAMVGFGMRRS